MRKTSRFSFLGLLASILLVGLFALVSVADAAGAVPPWKTTLSAGPSYPGATGSATYTVKGSARSILATLKGNKSVGNKTLDVYVSNVKIGSVKANKTGAATFKADSSKGQTVPNLADGAVIQFRLGTSVVAGGTFKAPITPVTLKLTIGGSTTYVGVRGTGDYVIDKTGKKSMKLQVKHLTAFANDTVDLKVNGVKVGVIAINSAGVGLYQVSATTRETVPTITDGSVISIESFDEPVGDGTFGDTPEPTETMVAKVKLFGSPDYPTASGEAEYDIDKGAEAEFELSLKNLTALVGQTLDVYVDGVLSVSATVNSQGQLKIKLESDKGAIVPTVTASSIVSVQLGGVIVSAGQFGSTGDGSGVLPEKWEAKLAAAADYPSARGEAEYELSSSGDQELEVKVKSVSDLVGQTLEVYIDGQFAGTLLVNSSGEAKLKLETEDGDVLPTLGPTSTVTVQFSGIDVVSGQFEGPTGGDDDDDDDGDGDSTELETELSAVGSYPDAEGKAKYKEESESSELEVEVEKAAADATVSIYVDGVEVGTLVLDDEGDGKFSLKSSDGDSVPTIAAGSTIEVRLGSDVVLSGQF